MWDPMTTDQSRIRREILESLQEQSEPLSIEELEREVDKDIDEEEFKRILLSLVDHNKISITGDWQYKKINRDDAVPA